MKNVRYTMSRCRKDDTLYGPKHGSEDCGYTLCGHEIDTKWWIVDNDFSGGVTCKQCLKELNERIGNENK